MDASKLFCNPLYTSATFSLSEALPSSYLPTILCTFVLVQYAIFLPRPFALAVML